MHRRFLIDNLVPQSNSLVTITVRDLAESGFTFFDPVDKYPIWDEKHRAELEKKIIEHYYMRQIGFETAGRFKFELNKTMREIMPRFIKIWKTTQYKYNPIENYNMIEGSTDLTSGSSESTHKNLEKFSDTPQGKIEENLDAYLTNATKNDGEASEKNDGKITHDAFRHGNIGVTTTQQLIDAERQITIDVDIQIIDALKFLFLGVY